MKIARCRVPIVASLLVAATLTAVAGDLSVGRLKIELPSDRWESRTGPAFQVESPGDRPIPGESAILILNDADSNPLAILFVGSTWSDGQVTAEGSCKGSTRAYVRKYPTDGFITFACAIVGGPFWNGPPLRNVLKRLGPALESSQIAVPPRAYLLQIVVASRNGGAIVLEGLLAPQLIGIPGVGAAAEVPSHLPVPYAALADAIGDAALHAARSVRGTFAIPQFAPLVFEQQKPEK